MCSIHAVQGVASTASTSTPAGSRIISFVITPTFKDMGHPLLLLTPALWFFRVATTQLVRTWVFLQAFWNRTNDYGSSLLFAYKIFPLFRPQRDETFNLATLANTCLSPIYIAAPLKVQHPNLAATIRCDSPHHYFGISEECSSKPWLSIWS